MASAAQFIVCLSVLVVSATCTMKFTDEEVEAVRKLCSTTQKCTGQTPEAVAKRAQFKQQATAQLLESGVHTKRSTAEAEVEDLLQTIQRAKKAVMTSMGLSFVEPVDDGLWQGDILLRKEEAEAIIRDHTEETSRARRSIIAADFDSDWSRGANRRWPWPINYYINPGFDATATAAIKKALTSITAAVPCLVFTQMSAKASGMNFIEYTNNGGGCAGVSPVGMNPTKTSNQIGMDISRCPNDCSKQMIVIHETLHSLGMSHEQCRGDRDSYIAIDKNKVVPTQWNNFEQDSNASFINFGQKYDYYSIMHYAKNTFGINGQQTMTAKQAPVQANTDAMGNQCAMSKEDIILLNKTYCQNPNGPILADSQSMLSPDPTQGFSCTSSPQCAGLNTADPPACPSGYTQQGTVVTDCFKCDANCATVQATDGAAAKAFRAQWGSRLGSKCNNYLQAKARQCQSANPVCRDAAGWSCSWIDLSTCSQASVKAQCAKTCGDPAKCSKAYRP